MSSCYTKIIESDKEVSLKGFILDCARSFDFRCKDSDGPLEEIPADISYIESRIKELQKPPLSKSEFLKEQKDTMKYYRDEIKKRKKNKTKCLRLLADVKNWKSPVSVPPGLKIFVIDQLESFINYDCSSDYYNNALKSPKEKYPEYLARMENGQKEGIKSALESIEKQKNNAKLRNNWIKALKDSLK